MPANRQKDKQVPKRSFKLKYELGRKIPSNQIPQVFFSKKPKMIPDVTQSASLCFKFKAFFLTPLKAIKRKFTPSIKTGY